MPTPASTSIFAQAEQEVYHACLEWPLWLVLRLRHLERSQDTDTPTANPKEIEHDHQATDC